MKPLERILLQYLVSTMKDKLDQYQFACKQGCGTDDTVATLVPILSKKLDKPNTYAKALFLDFLLAFNTTQADILVSKIWHSYLIHWFACFLTNKSPDCKGKQKPFICHHDQC